MTHILFSAAANHKWLSVTDAPTGASVTLKKKEYDDNKLKHNNYVVDGVMH